MGRVLVTEKLAQPGLDLMAAAGHEVDVQLELTPEQLVGAIVGAHALVIRSATTVTAEVLAAPRHPYTRALLQSVPQGSKHDGPLPAIPGEPPNLAALPPGCAFASRCPLAAPECLTDQPLLDLGGARGAACWRALA